MDAIERKNGMMLGDKKIKVSLARPSTEDIRNCKLYVTNLPKDYVDEDIFKLFSQVSYDFMDFTIAVLIL